jgi:hypothetical protein
MTHADPIQQAVDQWVDMERNASRYLKLQALLTRADGGIYLGKTCEEMNQALDALPEVTP